jgi:hypothetical protein
MMKNYQVGNQQQGFIPGVNFTGNRLRHRLRIAMFCLASVSIGFAPVVRSADAQSTWVKMKQQFLQQACKGGDQNACQELARLTQKLSQQGQPQQSGEQHPPAQVRDQPTAVQVSADGTEPDNSCCTAEAIKDMAAKAVASPVDIVGIKLGMTPDQARAAIKAHNPALTVWTVSMRLTHPGARNFVEVPYSIVATNNPIPEGGGGQAKLVGLEVIVLQFTLQPNAPVLTYASRYTNFEPTLAGNLVNALEKKYGPEYPRAGMRTWLYDSNGKPVIIPSRATDPCVADTFGPLGRQTPLQGNVARGNSTISLDVNTYKYAKSTMTAPNPACTPYSVVRTSLYTENGPNMQMTDISVMMASGGLNYASARSTDAWLQAEADALAKAAHDAAAQSKGTTF